MNIWKREGMKEDVESCVATIPNEAAQSEIFLSPIFLRSTRIIALGLLRSPLSLSVSFSP